MIQFLSLLYSRNMSSVTTAIRGANAEIYKRTDGEIWSYGETIADKDFKDKLDASPLAKIIGRVPLVKVSSQ